MAAAGAWQRLQQAATVHKVVSLPLGILTTSAGLARACKYWNPQGYAQWYLTNVSAGTFREPLYEPPWVENERMTTLVKGALMEHPTREQMTLISGLQSSGKTSAVLKQCHEQKKVGFYVSLGDYTCRKDDYADIQVFVLRSLIESRKARDYNLLQRVMWHFFPVPQQDHAWAALEQAFQKHPQQLVVVVDETQVLANDKVQHSGILNRLCAASPWGSIILIASEFAVGQHFSTMTHVASRTRFVYAPAATTEEMRPHVQARYQNDYSPKEMNGIVEACDGSFNFLRLLDQNPSKGVEGVRNTHRQQLRNSLQLTENGLNRQEKAVSTGEAMVAAAKMVFEQPVEAFDRATLELAQAGGAKIETTDDETLASWASPLTGEVMADFVCDNAIHQILKKRIPPELYEQLEATIAGKCPAQRRCKSLQA